MWRMNYSIIKSMWRLPKLLKTLHRMTDRHDIYSEQEIYDYARYIVNLMKRSGHIKTKCFGTENLPKDGGYVLYPNHQGKYDVYSIVDVHEKPVTVVMDREMSYFVLVSEIIDALRAKRMDINSGRHALIIMNQVAEEVAQGRRYIIFPEGGYDNKKRHTMWDFKPGCFKAAIKAGAPIVPVALVNSYKVYNSWSILPAKTQVHYLEPLYPEDYKDMSTRQISEVVKSRIEDKLNELGYGK